MKAERLFLNAAIQETVRSRSKANKRRKRPEEHLCDVLEQIYSRAAQANRRDAQVDQVPSERR